MKIKPGQVIEVNNQSMQELIDEIVDLGKKIHSLNERIEELTAENRELVDDICEEQDYNVLLWSVIAHLKGFKTS